MNYIKSNAKQSNTSMSE